MIQCRYSGACRGRVARGMLFCRAHWVVISIKIKDAVEREHRSPKGITPDTLVQAITEINEALARKRARASKKGLRVNMQKLFITLVCLIVGCAGNAAEPVTHGPTCETSSTAQGKQLWHFEHAADAPGVDSSCEALGDGWYECAAEACLLIPYDGTCPVCGAAPVPDGCAVQAPAQGFCAPDMTVAIECASAVQAPALCEAPLTAVKVRKGGSASAWCCP